MSPIPMKTTNDERSSLSPEIMNAIYGTVDDKKKAYEESLKRYVPVSYHVGHVPRHQVMNQAWSRKERRLPCNT